MSEIKERGKKTKWIALLSVSIVAILYLGSYIVLSYSGQYYKHVRGEIRATNLDGSLGFPLDDQLVWLPKYLDYCKLTFSSGKTHTFKNAGGIFYAPLILLDQAKWHQTIVLDEDLVRRAHENSNG